MKRLFTFAYLLLALSTSGLTQERSAPVPTIFAFGGELQPGFLKQVIALTGKTRPKICFVPTGTGDNPQIIIAWYNLCQDLPVQPYVLGVWVRSSSKNQSFEEKIMSMDAIIVGGGNTLNMMAIWKAQGIDTVLRNAYKKGILLAGGSAGSLCWFNSGYSDSWPDQLSIVQGLGLLPYSHSPHYHSEPARKPLYEHAILAGKLDAGYACDDRAGVLFRNGKYVQSFALDKDSHTYYLGVKDGKLNEQLLDIQLIGQ